MVEEARVEAGRIWAETPSARGNTSLEGGPVFRTESWPLGLSRPSEAGFEGTRGL